MTWPGEKQRHSMSARQIQTVQGSSTKRRVINDYDYTQGIKDMFKPGHVGHNKPYYDEDWFRYFPDGTWENHELCTDCNPDDTCNFHPEKFKEELEIISYPIPELIPTELQEELLEEFHKGIETGMSRNQAITSAVEYIVDKIENINNEGEEEKEVTMDTYYSMQNLLVREPSILTTYGKKYKPWLFKYNMPVGSLNRALNLQDGTKVKVDLDGAKIFTGTISQTPSDIRWVEKSGYNPHTVSLVTFWRGKIKNTDIIPENRIVEVKHPGDEKYTVVRKYIKGKERPSYQKVQVVNV